MTLIAKPHYLLRSLILTPSITVTDTEIVLANSLPAELRSTRSVVLFHQVASITVVGGLFTRKIVLETIGGQKHVVPSVPPAEAEAVVTAIRQRSAKGSA